MTLKANLKAALARARGAEDHEFVFTWGQMLVGVSQARSGYVTLRIERRDMAPTDGDWDQVVAQWPEPGPIGVVPTPRTEGKRHALIGRWARPAEVSQATQ